MVHSFSIWVPSSNTQSIYKCIIYIFCKIPQMFFGRSNKWILPNGQRMASWVPLSTVMSNIPSAQPRPNVIPSLPGKSAVFPFALALLFTPLPLRSGRSRCVLPCLGWLACSYLVFGDGDEAGRGLGLLGKRSGERKKGLEQSLWVSIGLQNSSF